MDYRLESLRYQLQEDPTSRVFFQLGELLRKEGQLAEAVQILEAGLEHHPRYVAAWVSLGRARHDLGAHERAEAAFAHALEIDPENQVAARLIGEAAISRGDFVRAVKALKLARALSPRDPELDERVAWVEGRLAEEGLLRLPEPLATPPAVKEPFEEDVEEVVFLDADLEIDTGADVSAGPAARPSDRDWPTEPDFEPPRAPDGSSEPFAVTDEDPFATRPPATEGAGVTQRAPARPSVVMASSAADPFSLEAMGDTGVWIVADDVFGEPSPEATPAVETVGPAADEDEAPFGEAPEVDLVAPVEAWAPEPAPAEDEPFGDASAPELPPLEAEAGGPFDAEAPAWEAPSPATTQRLLLSELPIPEPAPSTEVADIGAIEDAAAVGEEADPLEAFLPAEPLAEAEAEGEVEVEVEPEPPGDELSAELFDLEDEPLLDGETTIRLPPRDLAGAREPEHGPAIDEVALADAAALEEPDEAMVDEGEEAIEPPPLASPPAMDSAIAADLDPPTEVAAEAGEPVSPLASRFSDLEPLELGDEEPELEDEPLAEEVPLPTLTLARLALAQGELELAERTLESLLRHHPESSEAARLLAELGARRQLEGPAGAPVQASAAARISALQGWLEGIRLAAERRTR